ncbi:hypothetical protein DQQ01_15270 [Blautia argi]|uniref:Uncharacterized protein n=1 Tax=Blautia argi TaxID=1912897 RepID=A0A2Z4U784_9FIRM|nr:hypothetical protein DQQ01_00195 [Blautia argi]AWY99253.1 hypothetical protein DQQ01_15270 [Blautia argi]
MPIVPKMHNRLSKRACTAILIFETAHIYMYLENCIYETSKNTLNVEIETKRGIAKAMNK